MEFRLRKRQSQGGRVMSIDYAWEKFHQATLCLVGTGSIQSRLGLAAMYLIRLNEDNFPEDLRARFRTLVDSLTATDGPEGAISATTSSLDDDAANRLAGEIVYFYDRLARIHS